MFGRAQGGRALLTTLGALLIFVAAPAADQPQWGQRWSRNMVADETNLPACFDPVTGSNILWSTALGTQGFATPIVAGGKVFIGANNGTPRDPHQKGDRGVEMCFDAQNGNFCWQLTCLKLTNSIYWDWPYVGLCSPPTIESNRAYLVTNRGELLCLDLNGKSARNLTATDSRWRFDIIGQCGVRQHDSAHASPLLHAGFLYINTSNGVDDTHRGIAGPDAPSLVVLDKTTGRLVAQDDEHIGPNVFHSTWSSPALGAVGGRVLVFFGGGNGVLYAFDVVSPTTLGLTKLKKVWQFDCDPAAPKENIHSFLGNRKESPSNIYGMPVFYKNRIYVTVGGDMWWGKRQAWLKCIDASQTGDITKTGEIWASPLEHHSICTPAICDGLVFVTDVGHKIHCVDAETGKAYWTLDAGGEIWASPLIADGKVFVGTRKGEFLILAANRTKHLLSTVTLDGAISGTATAANGVLYIATANRLYAVAKLSVH